MLHPTLDISNYSIQQHQVFDREGFAIMDSFVIEIKAIKPQSDETYFVKEGQNWTPFYRRDGTVLFIFQDEGVLLFILVPAARALYLLANSQSVQPSRNNDDIIILECGCVFPGDPCRHSVLLLFKTS